LQSLAQGDQHLGAMDINAIICQIESITTNWELHIENVRDPRILATARQWYREQGYYSEVLHTFEIPSAARLTLGICLEDLVYEVSKHIDSGGTRTLIAALNDWIIMRILPSLTTKEHSEQYLGQSHASLRHLARGLGEGWMPTFERLQMVSPEQVIVQIEPPVWPVIHCE
jgi:hypothetical protein